MAAMKLVEFLVGMDRGGPQVIHQFSVQAKKSSCSRTSETPPPMSKSLIFGFLCARIKMGITISKCLLMIYSEPKTADATTQQLWHRHYDCDTVSVSVSVSVCQILTISICICICISISHMKISNPMPRSISIRSVCRAACAEREKCGLT